MDDQEKDKYGTGLFATALIVAALLLCIFSTDFLPIRSGLYHHKPDILGSYLVLNP